MGLSGRRRVEGKTDPTREDEPMRIVRIVMVASLIALVMTMASCSSKSSKDSDFLVQLEGDARMKVSGSMMVVKGDGTSVSETLTVTLPHTRPVKGTVVSVSMQKQDGGSGTLRVRIVKDNKVVAEGSTSAAYGVVTVAGS